MQPAVSIKRRELRVLPFMRHSDYTEQGVLDLRDGQKGRAWRWQKTRENRGGLGEGLDRDLMQVEMPLGGMKVGITFDEAPYFRDTRLQLWRHPQPWMCTPRWRRIWTTRLPFFAVFSHHIHSFCVTCLYILFHCLGQIYQRNHSSTFWRFRCRLQLTYRKKHNIQ